MFDVLAFQIILQVRLLWISSLQKNSDSPNATSRFVSQVGLQKGTIVDLEVPTPVKALLVKKL